MRPLLFHIGGSEPLAENIATHLGADQGVLLLRSFPDGESNLRFETPCRGRDVVLLCSLDKPNAKTLPLLLAGATLRESGARRVGLIAPYLAYMRQDKIFQAGQGVSARHYAQLLSAYFDWLVTVDPHLHRFTTLDQIYSIPTAVAHAAPLLGEWIGKHVNAPVLIGPDSESAQWVAQAAHCAGAPYLILEKKRLGDRRVTVTAPNIDDYRSHVPVLVDDILSTGQTLVAATAHLSELQTKPPICVAVHGLFASGALQALTEAGVSKIVTTNTVAHDTNIVDMSLPVAEIAAPFVH